MTQVLPAFSGGTVTCPRPGPPAGPASARPVGLCWASWPLKLRREMYGPDTGPGVKHRSVFSPRTYSSPPGWEFIHAEGQPKSHAGSRPCGWSEPPTSGLSIRPAVQDSAPPVLLLQGNDVIEDEDGSPMQEDGKRPGLVLPSLFLSWVLFLRYRSGCWYELRAQV